MTSLDSLPIKIFADGADKPGMLDLYRNPLIKGLTTNPTLMKKAGIADYEAFARDILQTVRNKPISFEVFADEFADMRHQALRISRWQQNVYVKIPIMNSRGESALPLIASLAREGVKLNVTAILTERQIAGVSASLDPAVPSVVSVFVGRIADTGRDPLPLLRTARELLREQPKAELLWASVREVFNIYQAAEVRAHIVTVPHDILRKAIDLCWRDLHALSLDTVRMFDRDAKAAGYLLDGEPVIARMTPTEATPRAAQAA